MAWSGGNFTRANPTWVSDAAAGIGIEAGRHDTQDNDFTTGINECLNKTGQNAMTGNLNLGGFIPTNIGAGTAAAPAICAGNDINTGIFSAAADQIGIATNGTERVRIDASGKVGVGTTTPKDRLQVGSLTTVTPFNNTATGLGFNYYYDGASKAIATGNRTVLVQLDNNGGSLKSTTGTQTADAVVSGLNTYMNWGGFGDLIQFYTGNLERMRVQSDGRVVIGTTSAGTARLYVRSLGATSADYAVWWENSSSAGLGFIRSDGLFNTGTAATSPYNSTTAAAANVNVDGSGNLQRSTSSARYKTDIKPYTRGLADVMELAPRFYKGINDGETQFAGLIAEDVHDAGLNEFVVYNNKGEPDALAYSNMVTLAFKAIQELNAKVEALEARIAALEA